MRDDRVKLFNPLPSHSSLLPLSLPLSSFSLKLGLGDFGAWLGGGLGDLLFFSRGLSKASL